MMPLLQHLEIPILDSVFEEECASLCLDAAATPTQDTILKKFCASKILGVQVKAFPC